MTAPDNLLAKVRALLAKAESTEFEAEAETFTAKAMALIAKYGIDEAMLAASGEKRDEIVQLRINLDNPYTTEKQTLLTAIARAMRCRCVGTRVGRTTSYCTLVGFESDLERVNLLYTSLLIQATSQLTRQRPGDNDFDDRYYYRRESVASYRRSWLVGFAQKIGERLTEAERRAAAQTVDRTPGVSTALVLRDRSKQVSQRYAELYPSARSRSSRVASGNGYRNGQSAGQRADLGATRIGSRHRALSS